MTCADNLLMSIHANYVYLYRVEGEDLYAEARFSRQTHKWSGQVWTTQEDSPDIFCTFNHFTDILKYCERKASAYDCPLSLEYRNQKSNNL